MLLETIFTKAITIALGLFHPCPGRASYHYSFAFLGAKLVGIGQNEPDKPNCKALNIAHKFHIRRFKNFPYLHSETDLISRLWGRVYLDRKVTIVNIRFSKGGQLRNSKPCKDCQEVLNLLDITNVFWSTNYNSFASYNGVVFDLGERYGNS